MKDHWKFCPINLIVGVFLFPKIAIIFSSSINLNESLNSYSVKEKVCPGPSESALFFNSSLKELNLTPFLAMSE